jgi:hypothetical protein
MRRHWHRGCWFKELRMQGGRRSVRAT